VLLGAVWIGSGVYRVDAQERAVVLRFGKYVQTPGPGLQLAPALADRAQDHRQRLAASTASRTMRSMLTADTNLVEVRSAVQYTQPDPRKYLFKVAMSRRR
jgi:modulator of FtsH protease HflK